LPKKHESSAMMPYGFDDLRVKGRSFFKGPHCEHHCKTRASPIPRRFKVYLGPRAKAGRRLGGLMECQSCGGVGSIPKTIRHRNCLWAAL
jgi:hypothetical protein